MFNFTYHFINVTGVVFFHFCDNLLVSQAVSFYDASFNFFYYFTLGLLIGFQKNSFSFSEKAFFLAEVFFGMFPAEESSPQLYQRLLALGLLSL